jgi:glycosyltransferase involved in cell wall biosynthesis
LDFVDAYSIYYDRAAKVERNILLKLIFAVESRRMKSYERTVAREFTTCVVSSSLDQRALLSTSSNGHDIQVIPNTIDTPSFEHSNGELESHSMAFVGYMGHKNNIDAVVHFCSHIFPWIVDRVSDAKFYIIGDNPSPDVRRLASGSNNIIVTGRVANLARFLAKSGVFVCPLRMGAGTRIKLLEAMAVGVPIVTSPLGCEGLDVTNGLQMLIADDDRAFVEAVIRLFQDRSLRGSLVKQARKFVQQHHDVAIVGTHLDRILASPRPDK